jgi:AbrB family looped-hinge helix DNA binding protein
MQLIKVSSKGQVVLPKRIRKKLSLDEKSYLVVEEVGGNIIMKKASERLDELASFFTREAKNRKISKEELLKTLSEIEKETWG